MLVSIDAIQRTAGVPKAAFPIFGGLTVGFIALAFPEILYWGFQNVDTLLESRPSSNSLSADLLLQLVAAKIVATALCRASGLVGGYYAPSLFIGAATGMAYGKLVSRLASISDPIFHISIFEVASPQAYGLVGMAATLAGVCQVPLTAVLLLFELTQDYRIVLPLLGAVGLSSLITSYKTRNTNRTSIENTRKLKVGSFLVTSPEKSAYGFNVNFTSPENSICELESSLCMSDGSDDDADLASEIPVSQAMRTRYVTTRMETCLMDTVSLLLEEKQSYAMIIDDDNRLIGQLTMVEIQQFVQLTMTRRRKPQVLRVSDLYCSFDKNCGLPWAVNPNTSLLTALRMMNTHGLSRLPVVLDDGDGHLVGVLDRESIDLASRAFAIREAGSRYENSKD